MGLRGDVALGGDLGLRGDVAPGGDVALRLRFRLGFDGSGAPRFARGTKKKPGAKR